MTFSSEVAQMGLFHYTALKMKEKRESYPTRQGFMNRSGIAQNLPVPVVLSRPLEDAPTNKIVPLGVSSVDEVDDQLDELLKPDMPVELSLLPTPLVAGEDEPDVEFEEALPVVDAEGDDE